MHRKIRGCVYRIVFDTQGGRFFTVGHGYVNVYDAETNQKLARLACPHPNQVLISNKKGIIAIKSTIGHFVFYRADTFELLGNVKIRNISNTDKDFFYDEKKNMLYGIGIKGLKEKFYIVNPLTLQYDTIPFEEKKAEGEKRPIAFYDLHNYEHDGFNIICNFSDIEREDADGKSLIYESSYGRYEIENNTLVLKEKYISTTERELDLLDIVEPEAAPQFRAFCKMHLEGEYVANFARTFRSERGVYFITSDAVYRQVQGCDFEEVYRAEYMSAYAEFGGRRYIGTWEWLLVQDIKE